MSVTGPSYNINSIKKLSEQQLGKPGDSARAVSWHQDYVGSCYVFVGGLQLGLTEGDVAIVFSQFGELIDVHLVRDKKTGKSKGFAFVGYEDQRSTDLAVDNFNGFELLGRRLRVDHVKEFRPPTTTDDNEPYRPSGPEGFGPLDPP